MEAMLYLSGLSGSASDPRYKHWTWLRSAQFTFPRPEKGPGDLVVTVDYDANTGVLFDRATSGVPFRYIRVHWLDEQNAAVLKVRFDRAWVIAFQTEGYSDGPPAVYVSFTADRWQYEK